MNWYKIFYGNSVRPKSSAGPTWNVYFSQQKHFLFLPMVILLVLTRPDHMIYCRSLVNRIINYNNSYYAEIILLLWVTSSMVYLKVKAIK